MAGAAHLSRALGMLESSRVERLERLITAFGLPIRAEGDSATVTKLMGSDKKRIAGRQRWVLPVSTGGVVTRADVPDDAVARALSVIVAKS
jgi:3-dehydroquinate synthetase